MATRNTHRVAFGQAVKSARKSAGLTYAQVEAALRWSAGKAWRVESGVRKVDYGDVELLARTCKLTREERERLHMLADAARLQEPPSRVADFARSYVALIRDADEVLYYDTELVFGVLQSEGYARSVLSHSPTRDIEQRLAERLDRRAVLEKVSPPAVRVVLGEAVLYRQVGGLDALHEQLLHLLKVGQLPAVSIRVLPFSAGSHRAMGVGFTLLRTKEPSITRVYTEGVTWATYLAEEREVAEYEREFHVLHSMALGEDATADLIRRRVDQLEHNKGDNE